MATSKAARSFANDITDCKEYGIFIGEEEIKIGGDADDRLSRGAAREKSGLAGRARKSTTTVKNQLFKEATATGMAKEALHSI
jgi:hypothetical protein